MTTLSSRGGASHHQGFLLPSIDNGTSTPRGTLLGGSIAEDTFISYGQAKFTDGRNSDLKRPRPLNDSIASRERKVGGRTAAGPGRGRGLEATSETLDPPLMDEMSYREHFMKYGVAGNASQSVRGSLDQSASSDTLRAGVTNHQPRSGFAPQSQLQRVQTGSNKSIVSGRTDKMADKMATGDVNVTKPTYQQWRADRPYLKERDSDRLQSVGGRGGGGPGGGGGRGGRRESGGRKSLDKTVGLTRSMDPLRTETSVTAIPGDPGSTDTTNYLDHYKNWIVAERTRAAILKDQLKAADEGQWGAGATMSSYQVDIPSFFPRPPGSLRAEQSKRMSTADVAASFTSGHAHLGVPSLSVTASQNDSIAYRRHTIMQPEPTARRLPSQTSISLIPSVALVNNTIDSAPRPTTIKSTTSTATPPITIAAALSDTQPSDASSSSTNPNHLIPGSAVSGTSGQGSGEGDRRGRGPGIAGGSVEHRGLELQSTQTERRLSNASSLGGASTASGMVKEGVGKGKGAVNGAGIGGTGGVTGSGNSGIIANVAENSDGIAHETRNSEGGSGEAREISERKKSARFVNNYGFEYVHWAKEEERRQSIVSLPPKVLPLNAAEMFAEHLLQQKTKTGAVAGPRIGKNVTR